MTLILRPPKLQRMTRRVNFPQTRPNIRHLKAHPRWQRTSPAGCGATATCHVAPPAPASPSPLPPTRGPLYPPRVPPDPTGYYKDIFRIPLRASLCRCPPSTPQEGGLHRQLLSLSHNPPSPSLGYLQVPSFASTVPSSQIPLPPQEPSF